jgi:hypothetical protein
VSHSPEPWKSVEDGSSRRPASVVDAKGHTVAEMPHINGVARSTLDARRIAACVNACRGIPTEALESRPRHLIQEAQGTLEIVVHDLLKLVEDGPFRTRPLLSKEYDVLQSNAQYATAVLDALRGDASKWLEMTKG